MIVYALMAEDLIIDMDIEGLKLDIAILQSQMSNISESGFASSFVSANTLLRSKQTDLENIIKTQELLIDTLKQENKFIQSKLSSLEYLLFAESPKAHASVTVNGSDCSAENGFEIQENSSAQSTNNESSKKILVTDSINSPSNKNKDQEQLDTRHGSPKLSFHKDPNVPLVSNEDINVAVQTDLPNSVQNVTEYSAKYLPKHMVFCPFLRKKGHCLKGMKCDFSHNDVNQQSNQSFNLPKCMVFCPFLRKKEHCLKGQRCDFSHNDLTHPPVFNQSLLNDKQGIDQALFLEKMQNLLSSMNHIERALERMELSQTPLPRYPPFPTHSQFAMTQPHYQRPQQLQPRPLMEISTYPPLHPRRQ